MSPHVGTYLDAICEPAGAAQEILCQSCLELELCRTANYISTSSASSATVFSDDSNDRSSMAEGCCKMLGRESSKRSVSGMKRLLPLRLLSQTLPQSSIWPPTRSDYRSTFGTDLIPLDQEQEPTRMRPEQKSNNHLGLSLPELALAPRPQHLRDTPIYKEPGSPCFGRAYYTEKDKCFTCSSPGSECGGEWSLHDNDHPKESGGNEEATGDESSSQSNVGGGIEFSRQSYASSTTDISRSSVLSFQCSGLSGEKLFPDEGAWLSSPLPDSLKSKNRRRSSARGPDHRVQSWLNDTSETEVGEDIDVDFLAQATILSPSRAHLVRLNRDRTSGVATTTSFCPPPYHVDARYDCASSDDSPPDTTTGEWEFDDNRSARKELPRVWEPQWIFPNRPPDLAKASPPITPRVFPGPSRFSLSTMSAGLEKSKEPDPTSRFSNPSTISEPKSTVDIISDLEDTILRFPSAMLVPSAPCMRAIRLNLAISRSQGSTRTQTQSPMIKNFSLPRRSPALKTSKSSPAVHTTFCRSSILPEAPSRNMQTTPCHGSYTSLSNPPLSTSSPAPTDEYLPSLDLEALHRIFPGSTEFTRLALYAHILAYAFITSLPPTPTPASSTTDKVAKTRRDTPYWSDSPVASNFADATFTSSPGVQIRNTALRASIRKCIFRLLNNMDSSLPIPSTDQEYGSSELVLRSVSEVVQGCEELAFSSRRF